MSLPPLPDLGPDELDPREEAVEVIRHIGAPAVHVEWFADALIAEEADRGRPASEPRPSVLDRIEEHVLQKVFSTLKGAPDVAMICALYQLSHRLSRPERGGARGREEAKTFDEHRAREFETLHRLIPAWIAAEPRIDFASAIFQVPELERRADFEQRLVVALVSAGRLDPCAILDLPHLRGYERSQPDAYGTYASRDPRGVHYWFRILGSESLGFLLPLIDGAPDDEAGAVSLGVVGRLRDLMFVLEDEMEEPKAEHVLAWISRIEERLARRPDDLLLAGSLWTIVVLDRFDLGEDTERRLLDFTLRRLSRLRHGLATGTEPVDPPSRGHAEHHRNAIDVVYLLGGHWKALKTTLLLLRALPVAAVGPDLRYMHEPGDRPEAEGGPPTTWRWVADYGAGIVRNWALNDRAEDPELLEMRGELARFLLDRLRSRLDDKDRTPKDDTEMREPRPEWRRGCIQAVRKLRVNPGGRGHHVLHWLRSNDPDPQIRGEAATAYDEMINDVLLPPGMSPLRAVLSALGWLRHAHRDALGLPVDLDAARRARRTETRLAKEVELRSDGT